MIYIEGLTITIWLYGGILLFRNKVVYQFRRSLIEAISQVATPDIAVKFLSELKNVTYEDMVWEWWKPCRSFYSKEILKLLD